MNDSLKKYLQVFDHVQKSLNTSNHKFVKSCKNTTLKKFENSNSHKSVDKYAEKGMYF